MNIITSDLIKWAETELRNSGIESARKEAEILFMDSFNMSREDIFMIENFEPLTDCVSRFRNYVGVRASRYPLQYLLRHTEFMGLRFELEEGVFIPRPETELLVEKTLEYINLGSSAASTVNILDIGTGCGNIAISLAKNTSDCKIVASDISKKSLRVAERNARSHGVYNNITFIESNLFDRFPRSLYKYFDIIISNGPYIRRTDLGRLQPEVLYEDSPALDGGDDGLCFYRLALDQGVNYLKEGGIFVFEIGYDESEGITGCIKNDSRFSDISFYKDYNGYDRIIIIKFAK